MTTSYEYLGLRFGRNARFATSALFMLARLGWLGTVIYAPAMAFSVVTGLPLWATILLMGAIATGYTVLGGVSADIWTDSIQFVIMVGGAVWVAVTLMIRVPDGLPGILALARETGHLNIMSWRPDLFEMTGLAVGISFFFQLMQEYGTDQTTVQRLMATPTYRGMSLAIIFNAIVDFFLIGLLLFIGIGIFAYYHANAALLPGSFEPDQALPFYVMHALPNGVSGLLITTIFAAAMSSMDSGISSLATVVINDFVKPLRSRPVSDRQDLKTARGLTLLFGVFATGVAFYITTFEHIIEAYTTIISLFNGPILAIFLLGILACRTSFAAWVAGACISVTATLWLQKCTEVHWVYYFPFSFGICFLVTVVLSLVRPSQPPAPGLTLWDSPRSAS